MKEKWKAKWKKRSFRIRVLAVLLATAVLAGVAVHTVWSNSGRDGESFIYKEETVQKGDLVLGIMESGSISLEETSLDYTLELDDSDEEDEENSGDDEEDEEEETIKYPVIEEVCVAAGQRIEEGDILFRLTAESAAAVRKRLNSLCTEAQIAYAEAKADYELQLLSAKSTYDTSVLEAERAQSSLQASSAITRESVSRLTADIKVLEAENTLYREQLAKEELWEQLAEAQTAFTAAENVYENTDVHNATAYADNYAEYKKAKEQLESIRDQIDGFNKSIADNEKSIEEKKVELADAQALLEAESQSDESAYDSAVLGGELAEDIYRYTAAALEETVNAAKADSGEALKQLEAFEAFAGEDGVIRADGTGLVTEVSYKAGDELKTAGPMVSYVKEDAYTVSIDVSEEDISAIRVGDQVEVVISAYPDDVYEGTVEAVTTTASSEDAATVSYPVTIRIEGDTSLLYGGMTAAVTFAVDSVSNVLYVSRKAVQVSEGKSFVYVDAGGGEKKPAEVETGFSDGSRVEIVSGLSEGDTVYIKSKISASKEELMKSGNSGGNGENDSGEAGDGRPGNMRTEENTENTGTDKSADDGAGRGGGLGERMPDGAPGGMPDGVPAEGE